MDVTEDGHFQGIVPHHHLTKDGRKLFGPHSCNLEQLLSSANDLFRLNTNEETKSRLYITRVVDYDELSDKDKAVYDKLMRKQVIRQIEVDGWHELNGRKILIMGKFIQEGVAKHARLCVDCFHPNLDIDPSLGMTRDQFKRLYGSMHRATSSVLELKLLVDSMLDNGERIIFEPNLRLPGADVRDSVLRVVQCEKADTFPKFYWNPFVMICPDADPRFAHCKNDAAAAVMWNEVRNPSKPISQSTLFVEFVTRTGQKVQWLFDPTYSQILSNDDVPYDRSVFTFPGPFLDERYYNSARLDLDPTEVQLFRKPEGVERFCLSRVEDVIEMMQPSLLLKDDNKDLLCFMYRTPRVIHGLFDVISVFCGSEFVDDRMLRFFNKNLSNVKNATRDEEARRSAYYANVAKEMQAQLEKDAKRKARAAFSRAEKAQRGELPFSTTRPQLPSAKSTRRRVPTEEERLKHAVKLKQKPIMTACFEKKQAREHSDAVKRKEAQRDQMVRTKESEAMKDEAARTHRVPEPPVVYDFVKACVE